MKFGKEQLSTSTTRSHLAHPMESGCRSSSSEQPEAHVGYHFSKLDFNSKYLELSKFIFLLFSLFLAKLDSNKLLFPQNSKASLTSHERSTIFVIFLFQTHSLAVVISLISYCWKWKSWSTNVIWLRACALKILLEVSSNIHQSRMNSLINTQLFITQL